MEAARIAAERAHRVSLVEAGPRLGGTAWFSQLTTPANGPLVDWLEHEIARLGVTVTLGTPATADSVAGLAADAVIVATGRSEEHTSELQSLMRISYAVFCLKKNKNQKVNYTQTINNTQN